jgi:hypothetical protein
MRMRIRTAIIAGSCLTAAACSSAPQPEGAAQPQDAPRPEEVWVAATCSPASPDTTGWKVHQFSDLELTMPPEFNVRNRTTRSIEFVYRASIISLEVSTSATRLIFHAAGRPAFEKEEAGCSTSWGGYPGVVMATARANRFAVTVEWDGGPLWGQSDWRKRLVARVSTSYLRDAQRMRDALHTLRVANKDKR